MTANFPATSRYALTPTGTFVRADGTPVTYLCRRFVPAPESFALLQWHRVAERAAGYTAAQHPVTPNSSGDCAMPTRAMSGRITATIGQAGDHLPEGIPGAHA